MVEEILEKACKKAESAEIIMIESEETPITFKADILHSLETKHTTGLGLRIIKEGRIGFSSTTNLKKKTDLVRHALESARFGQEAKFQFPSKAEGAKVKIKGEGLDFFSQEEGIDLGKRTIQFIKERDNSIQCDVYIINKLSKVRMLNSLGLNVSYEKATFSFFLVGFTIIEGSFVWAYEGKSSCRLFREEAEDFAKKILKKVSLARKTAPFPTQKTMVIFTSEALPNLISALELGTNGKRVQKGSSPLTGRLGEKILDSRLNIFDDGTLDYGIGTSPIDHEGITTQRTPLFENGVLKNYVFDLQTA